jgi:arabinofuranosyltransferase
VNERLLRLGAVTILILLVACGIVAQIAIAWGSTQDDAFATFRFARNMARGEGPAYNPGERVEGDTSLLWTALLCAAVLVGGDPASIAPLLGAGAAVAIAALLVISHRGFLRRGREADDTARSQAAVPWVTALSGAAFLISGSAFMGEAVQGLETSLFALVVSCALLLDARERELGRRIEGGRSGWIYALAAIARPWGLAVFAVAALARVGGLVRNRLTRQDLRAEALWAARALGPAVGYLLFRFFYYGEFLGGGMVSAPVPRGALLTRGGRLVLEFVSAYLPVCALALVGIAARRGRQRSMLTAAWTGAVIAWVLWSGGGDRPTFRLFAPVVPLLCLAAADGLDRILDPLTRAERAPGRRVFAGAAAAFGLCVGVCGFLWVGSASAREFASWRRSVLPQHALAGRWLASHCARGTLLATVNAGALPYYSDFRTIDMMGRFTGQVGRRGRSMDDAAAARGMILLRNPDIILFSRARFTQEPLPEDQVGTMLFGAVEGEIWRSGRLQRDYRWTSVPLPGFHFNFYERADRAGAPGGKGAR